MTGFKIAGFYVDVARCRVSSKNYETILEPKVIDVLQYLHQHKGQVVSQEQIFSAVWPNSTFNPSSVQRCIALLRKALKEDSKNAKLLITHPKRGYSLELPSNEVKNYVVSKIKLSVALAISLVLCACILLFPQSIKTTYSTLLPVTSSGENESYLSLSPNGQYLAFVRGDDLDKNIWLRELSSSREVKLTQQSSVYHSLGWKPDSSALAFIESKNSQRIMSYLALDSLKLSPLAITKIADFPVFHITSGKLQWHSDNLIYFIETNKRDKSTWLSYIDLKSGAKHQMMQAQGQDWLKTLALSPNESQIALGYEMGLNRYRVDLVDMNNLSAAQLVQIEDSIQGLSWHPSSEFILISNRSILQLVDMQGLVSQVDFNNYKFVRDAQFTSEGNEIFMELRNVDVDILRKTKESPDKFETLVDTSSLDFLPIFSPDDSRFVFQSHRAGLKQLYVYENGQQRLIFANPNNEELFGVVWTPNGEEVFAASGNKLFKINVKLATYEEMPHSHQPFGIREHFQSENALLVAYRAEDGVTFHLAKLDLQSLSLTTYETEGERLVCYSMALGDQDQIYFANNKEVFRINKEAKQERLWSTSEASISGLHINNGMLSLRLDNGNDFKLMTVNIESGQTEVIHQGTENGDMLINTSHDGQQFLYLSKPIRTSELVKLN